jgi:glutamine amidotransferase
MSAPVVIVDYGLGNLRSVAGAVEKVGYTACVSSSGDEVLNAKKLILPGVGAFGDGMAKLRERELVGPLNQAVRDERTPILGICLGAQLMASESSEFGQHRGLGWLPARVVKIEPTESGLRVPHVGWNGVRQLQDDLLFHDVPDEALFYFVHSFHVVAADPAIVRGTCEYGGTLSAVFRKDNICGTQFHPEKSQRHGLTLLKNFLDS